MTSTADSKSDEAPAGEAGESGVEETQAEETGTREYSRTAVRLRRFVPRGRRARVMVSAVLVVLLGAGAAGYYWYQEHTLPDGAAFRVGEQLVTTEELDSRVDTLRALYGVQVPTEPDGLATFRRDSAKAAAVGLILTTAAAEHDVVIPDKTARDTLSKFIAQQFGEGQQARDKFVQALGAEGTNEQAVLDEIKRQLVVNQLFNRITEDVAVTDEEVTKAFPERKDELGTPERRQLANIVVASESEAAKLAETLRGGADFARLAMEHSLDGSTRDRGGDLGELSRDQLAKEYGKAAFTAKPGEVFGPVHSEHGWNIGKVTRVLPAVPPELSKVRDRLKEQLTLENSLAQWRDWLGTRIANADVVYADEYRPTNPDAVPTTGHGAPGNQGPR